jgi:beta-glucosidase/6-phospho-beta-glucosidase/beta-galactosidase
VLRLEAKALRLENESLRSAVSVMSAKMTMYHEKVTKMHRVLQLQASTQQMKRMQRLEKALQLSHTCFLKMERKNKVLEETNRRLRQTEYNLEWSHSTTGQIERRISDASFVSVDHSSTSKQSNTFATSQEHSGEDECEIISTTLPQLKCISGLHIVNRT